MPALSQIAVRASVRTLRTASLKWAFPQPDQGGHSRSASGAGLGGHRDDSPQRTEGCGYCTWLRRSPGEALQPLPVLPAVAVPRFPLPPLPKGIGIAAPAAETKTTCSWLHIWPGQVWLQFKTLHVGPISLLDKEVLLTGGLICISLPRMPHRCFADPA